MKTRTLTFFVLATVLTFPISAVATDPVSFRFTGHVTEIDDDDCSVPLLEPGVISIDDPVSGIFTYDLDAIDTDPDPNEGYYDAHSPPMPNYVTINGLSFQADPDDPHVAVYIYNDKPFFPFESDEIALFALTHSVPYSDLGLDDPEVTIDLTVMIIGLFDFTATVFSGDSLPSSLDLDDWDVTDHHIDIRGNVTGDPSCSFNIRLLFDIDSLDLCLDNETGLCSNGIDDDCDGNIDAADPDCATTSCSGSAASTVGVSPVYSASDLGRQLAYFLLPLGSIIALGFWRRKR